MACIPILCNCDVQFIQNTQITVTPCEQFHKIACKQHSRIQKESYRVNEPLEDWEWKMWCTIFIAHPHGERFAYWQISTQFLLCIDKMLENEVFCYITEYMIYACDNSENERDKVVVRRGNISHYWDKYENTYQSSTFHIIWQLIKKKTQTNILIRLLEISANKIYMEY